MTLTELHQADCLLISHAFQDQGWHKPSSQYEHYLHLQQTGKRDLIVARISGEFAGYLTISWESGYAPFQAGGIPEVVDFNVLKKFQRRGIGTALMDEAEKRIHRVSDYAGIGVGVTADYGPAHILYIKRNYVPDGRGLTQDGSPVQYGGQIEINDGVVLYMVKALGSD